MKRTGCSAWKWKCGHIAGVWVIVVSSMILAGCLTVPKSTFSITYQGNGNTSGSVSVDTNKYSNGQTITTTTTSLARIESALVPLVLVEGGSFMMGSDSI